MTPTRATVWLTALAVVAACSPAPQSAQSRASRATVAACRGRADEVYLRQNRASLYAVDARDSPESASYNSGITSRGLADRYGWSRQVSDCVRSQGSTADPIDPTGPTMQPRGR